MSLLCAGYGDFDPRLYPNYNVIGLHKSNPLVAGRPMNACGSCLEVQCRDREVWLGHNNGLGAAAAGAEASSLHK